MAKKLRLYKEVRPIRIFAVSMFRRGLEDGVCKRDFDIFVFFSGRFIIKLLIVENLQL